MCFSNLPVEFDEDGTPRLAEPDDESAHDHDTDSDTVAVDDEELDPERCYQEILADLPERTRNRIETESQQQAHPTAEK